MSIELNDDEVLSNFFVDNIDKKSGGNWDFVCPAGQSFVNYNRIKRMALNAVYMTNLPYDINDRNNKFTITDGTNSYQVVIPIGYINTQQPSAPNYFITLIQTAMNANTFGWVFTVSYNPGTGIITWTSTVPTRVSFADKFVFNTFGIRVSTTLSTSYTNGAIICGTNSNVLYVCSRQLTRFSVRDAHTNSIINNTIGTISITNFLFGVDYAITEKQITQMKIFDFEPSTPIGSEIDIFFLDCYGLPILDSPVYDSNRITLEFKVISVRNPIATTLLQEYAFDNNRDEPPNPKSRIIRKTKQHQVIMK
jgi:hypothetical protein